jgi:UDP-N-acetylglucosamine--N-acetylmuramyl-(pentapeptide) pyrophosphoryl-undecaprenol N-acetylglucosamine transferase
VRGAARALTILPRARALVKRLDPDVVFSVGGYAAGPITLAARMMGVPVTLMEPNAVLGFTNKLLRPLVQRAYVCFPEAAEGFGEGRVLWTGVPLRKRFEPADYQPGQPPTVLVMGGSQGALALNEVLPHAIAALLAAGRELKVVHQTGKGKDAEVRALYGGLGIDQSVRVTTFIDDVAAALAEADIVVERSGAGSLAELCAIGRPGVLVPYPHAADDHQRHNAESLARDGAAVCIVQRDATADRLERELAKLIDDPSLRHTMAAAARGRGRPDAARQVARDLIALAEQRRSDRALRGAGREGHEGRDDIDSARRRLPAAAREVTTP